MEMIKRDIQIALDDKNMGKYMVKVTDSNNGGLDNELTIRNINSAVTAMSKMYHVISKNKNIVFTRQKTCF